MEELLLKDLDSQEDMRDKQIIPILSTTFEQILQLGLDLNLIYVLEGFSEGISFSDITNQEKLEVWKQTLVRKGYLLPNSLEVSTSGLDLLRDIGMNKVSIVKKQREKQKQLVTSFDLWWKAYPPSDTFVYKGRKFVGSRALRTNKEQCAIKFNKIMKEGLFTVEEMIAALELEVKLKKEETLKGKGNKMSYFQNSLTYLNQRTFEPFIEMAKTGDNKPAENQEVKRFDI